MTDPSFYVPADVDAAHEAWGANCGPCAVAAVLGRDVEAVRPLFDPFPGYSNPTLIREALKRAGRSTAQVPEIQDESRGVAFVQWCGPWQAGGARAAYRHTHWIGYHRTCYTERGIPVGDPVLFVYDTAYGTEGGWAPLFFWVDNIVPLYLENHSRATGWEFRMTLEVR